MHNVTFANGREINLAHARQVGIFWPKEEMDRLHSAFITCPTLGRSIITRTICSAKKLAPENTRIPEAFAMWLMAVHDEHPEDEEIEETLRRVCTGEILIENYLIDCD